MMETRNRAKFALDGLNNPQDVINLFRAMAYIMREDAAELRAAWQDESAGKLWDNMARSVESCADGPLVKAAHKAGFSEVV